MRAGKMVHTIQVQRFTSLIDEYGTPDETWTSHKYLRAEIIERTATEFINAQGAGDKAVIIFRTRFVDDITNADRVQFESQDYNIKEISRIGRRTGLELRCVKLGDD